MKIIRLEAANVKRLRAVEITPDGNTVVIAGKNGQGKTSILDSILLALGGGAAAKDTIRPIRDGEDEAHVTLDLGELVVTRTWTKEAGTTRLVVAAPDGARYTKGQTTLDALVGRLSFDPMQFSQQDARAQLATLLELVELPFDPDELQRRRDGYFAQRTDVGRAGKQLEGQLAGMPAPAEGAPTEPVDVAALLAQHRAAMDAHREYDHAVARVEAARAGQVRAEHAVQEAEAALERARKALGAAQDEMAIVADAVPDQDTLPDVHALEQQLLAAETTNADVLYAQQRAKVQAELDATLAHHQELTAAIKALDEERAAGVAAAAMPLEGLAFDDDGVTYRGVPFKQCSAAEQLRVSMAIAMAANPRIRIIRITDGSLLDSDNMALIASMADEHDFQVWIERVDESGQQGIVIEDGQVVQPTAAP